MHARSRPIWIGLAVLALAVLVLLLIDGERAARETNPTASSGAAPLAPSVAAALSPSDQRLAELQRAKVAAPTAADLAQGAGEGDAQSPVHLRVFLRREDQAGGLLVPERCEGWKVQAQSWIRETHAVFPHEALADREGVAEFVFPGFVHVDWISCQPPSSSGLAFSYDETHTDVNGGSTIEMTLLLRAGGPLAGRVIDLRDQPVGGAVVHLYNPQWTYGLSDWTPGFMHVATDAGGAFLFPPVAAGEWVVGVELGEWLQIAPPLGAGIAGEDQVEVVAGGRAPEALLRVMPTATLEVDVADARGQGAAAVSVLAEPVLLADGLVQLFSRQDLARSEILLGLDALEMRDDRYDVFLSGGDPDAAAADDAAPDEALHWPFNEISAETDAAGAARLRLPHGRWRISIQLQGDDEGVAAPEPQLTDAPGAPLHFQLPFTQGPFSGRVVDEGGRPIPGAEATLLRRESGLSFEALADADGRFSFANVPGHGEWDLTLRAPRGDLASSVWTVRGDDREPRDYLLPAGRSLRVQLRDSQGGPMAQDNAHLLLKAVNWEAPPRAGAALVGRPAMAGAQADEQMVPRDFERDDLLPGNYELELWAYVWNGGWGPWGNPDYDLRHLTSWSVQPRPEPWVLTWDAVPCTPGPSDWITFQGVVRDAVTGRPLADASVMGRDGEQGIGWGSVKDDGSYALTVRPGALSLFAHAPGYLALLMPTEVLGPGEQRRDLFLTPASAGIQVRLRDREGRRLPACEVFFFDADGAMRMLRTPQGNRIFGAATASAWLQGDPLTLEDLPPGKLVLEARFWGLVRARASVELAAGANPEVEARLDLSLDEIREQLRAAAAAER